MTANIAFLAGWIFKLSLFGVSKSIFFLDLVKIFLSGLNLLIVSIMDLKQTLVHWQSDYGFNESE